LYDGKCKYRLDSGSWSPEFDLPKGTIAIISVPIQAPPEGSGSGSAPHTVYAQCYDTGFAASTSIVPLQSTFTLIYDNTRYEAKTAISAAQSTINSAQTSINNAQTAINDAKTSVQTLRQKKISCPMQEIPFKPLRVSCPLRFCQVFGCFTYFESLSNVGCWNVRSQMPLHKKSLKIRF
jgi:hypothetical protein